MNDEDAGKRICLIHSQIMRYAQPSIPSPELRIVGYAARELFKKNEVDVFLLVADTVMKGYKESEVSAHFIRSLGIPSDRLIVRPSADSTDGELAVFKEYILDQAPPTKISVITIEAKKGRMELIEERLNFYPHIYYAEDVAMSSDDADVVKETTQWRKSFRHTMIRIRLGLLPLWVMHIDHEAKFAQFLARALRHQS